ncbi:MAG TPA: DMT family transporter [Micromonosporaceae bacterium]|nr:DMT family transporter [Micromonosporaceae bacterium]
MTAVSVDPQVRPVRWLPGFVALAAIWGASFLFIKVGVSQLHPVYLTLGRVATGALTLLAVLVVTRDRLPRDPKLWGHLAVIAAFANCLAFTLFGYGEQRISSVLAGIWNGTTPLATLLVAVLVFRSERATVARVVGVATGFVGLLVVLGAWRGVGGAALTGQLMCLGAAVCYGLAFPYMKKFLTARPESGVSLSAAQLLMATAELAVIAPFLAGSPPDVTQLHADVIGSVLALGMLGTGLAFVLNLRVVRLAGATTASTVTYLIPIFATIVGVIVLGEQITWYQPVGAAIVLLGVAISQGVSTQQIRHRYAGMIRVGPRPVGVGAVGQQD